MPVAFLGRLSNDAAGRELARVLSDDGVDLGLASVGPEPTTTAFIRVDDAGVAADEVRRAGAP